MECRLIPLNKVHPKIAPLNKYWPITIMSPLLKFVETYNMEKLRRYCLNDIEKCQTGFISKLDIQVNLFRLGNIIWEQIRRRRGRKMKILLFIDFKAAYDRVKRSLLYHILERDEILNNNEIQLIKWVHQKVIIKMGKYQTETYRGLPQGSSVSPLLFNIFLNELLKLIRTKFGNKITSLGYADDLLFVADDKEILIELIKEIERWCISSKMELNKSKSGILLLFGKEHIFENEDNIKGIPLLDSYQYLGVKLNQNFDISSHFVKLKSKVNFLTYRLNLINRINVI